MKPISDAGGPRIHSLYLDFFRFLNQIASDPEDVKKWPLYNSTYYRSHKSFLDVYYSQSLLSDRSVLKGRVEAIKPGDYGVLEDLCARTPPERTIAAAYKACLRLVPPLRRPDVYLLVGFFSPEGFVMHFRGKPVICFGLERFSDFRLFHVFFAHEYAHFLLNSSATVIPDEHSARWLIIKEGLATLFPTLVYPELEVGDSFLFRRDELTWCRDNEALLRDAFCGGLYTDRELIGFFYQGSPHLGIPARAAKYLGYLAVKRHLAGHPETSLPALLLDKRTALSIDICAAGQA